MGGVVSRWKARKTDPPSNEEEKEDEAELTHALDFAWVTLATNDSYCLGALVLAHSLRNANTAYKLAVLITPGVSPPMKEQLSTVFDVVKMVDVLDSKDEAHLALMKRPELGVTFTKIHCWRLTEFEKCVFLDADTLVIKNCDELFEREELSAAPDVGWPDCFNTGVFVFKPSIETFENIIKFSLETGSFDGGDQGLLNQFFGDWATKDINKHLPFVYNLTSVALYSYIPAFKQYGSEVRIVHFIGTEKPWLQQLDPQTRTVSTGPGTQHLAPMLQIWWNIFCDKVHPSMTSNLECDSGMRNDEIEACVNDNLIEPEPEIIHPFTPYLDKDDSRQSNLPYQNFDVKSTTGELLNISYLEKREQEMKEEEKRKEEIGIREEVQEEVEEDRKQDESHERSEMMTERQEEMTKDTEVEEKFSEEQPLEESSQEQTPQIDPFNYETFFPDETCVQQYLQQNIMTYQPLEHNEKKQDDMIVPEEHHLPRFLTIPEDDKRQSLNKYCRNHQESSNTSIEDKVDSNNHCNPENQNKILNKFESFDDCHLPETSSEPIKSKCKSLSNLEIPHQATVLEKVSFWKSHPNLIDPNKRYSMPKLKPIIPKQNTYQTFVSDVRPRITQYTEFQMSCDHSDEVPYNTLGFVERHILEEAIQRVPNTETERLKTLSYIFPLGTMDDTKLVKESTEMDEIENEMDCDLSLCQRQKGNQPLQNMTKKRSNSCFLPVLKPIRPSKNEESKRLIRPNSRLSNERGTKTKFESRKTRQKAKIESNINKSNSNTSNVEDILKKLIDFSKDYQEYFNECPEKRKEEKEIILGAVFKDVFAASTKDSPRIQYSKEFEEPLDSPLSPFLNGHTNNKIDDAMEGKENDPMNENVTESTQEMKTNELYAISKANVEASLNNKTIPLTDVNNELEKRERTVQMVQIPPNLSKDEIGPINGLETVTNGIISCSETTEAINSLVETIETNGLELSVNQKNGMKSQKESSRTYASIVKEGNKTCQTIPAQSNKIQPKVKKSAKGERSSSKTDKKKKKEQPSLPKQNVRLPPLSPSPEVAKSVEKPANLFNLLPEESSSNMILKPTNRKSKSAQSQPSQRRPKRKTKQDRRVVESLPTFDDDHVDNSGIAGAIAKLSIQSGGLTGAESETASSAQEDFIRRQNWEMGTMDYMGRDSFDNIWSKICETIDGKVTKDLNPDGVSTAPSAEVTTPKKDDLKSEKSQVPSQETLEKMTEQGTVIPPEGNDTTTGTGTIGSEITAKASEIASKATEALEVFGKLFVSGPVAIKSEVAEEGQKAPETAMPAEEKKSESQTEEGTSAEVKKSSEIDEEGKSKKGVINKILELVGVGKPETSTAVFYDQEQSENEKSKDDRGNSVFYDKEISSGDTAIKEEPKLSAEEMEGGSKVRAPSPSLILKTTPGTEVIHPTPPPIPMTPQIDAKDDRMLTVDDTIKATPPVTDKKFDDIPKPDTDTIKAEVDNIIDEAKKKAESKLLETKTPPQTPASSTSMALVPRLNDALEVFGKMFVSGPVTIKSEIPEEGPKMVGTVKAETEAGKIMEDAVKPAIPMPGIPVKMTEPKDTEVVETTSNIAPTTVLQQTESAKTESTTQPTELVAPTETQASEPTPDGTRIIEQPSPVIAEAPSITEAVVPPSVDMPKPEESSTPIIAEATAAAVEAIAAVLTKAASIQNIAQIVTDTISPGTKPMPPEAGKSEEQSTSNVVEEVAGVVEAGVGTILSKTAEPAVSAAEPLTPQPEESALPVISTSPSIPESGVTKTADVIEPAKEQVKESQIPANAQETDTSISSSAPSTPKIEVPISPEVPKPSEMETSVTQQTVEKMSEAEKIPIDPKTESSQSPSTLEGLSKANEALEAFGKHFVSGPVVLKSEVAEPEKPIAPEKPVNESITPVKEPEPSEGHSKASEALEAFGRSFISGPITVKSEMPEEVKRSSEAETDAVHQIFQSKPEDEPIYSNIEEVEEIKVTSEEDRKKEKPQTSKLTEQILKAIPPEMRKPFTEAGQTVSSEVAQLLSSAEQQTTNILLDKPIIEEVTPVSEEGDTSGPSVPPVPPRRNRSKGRDAPQPPPKKKGKNGKD